MSEAQAGKTQAKASPKQEPKPETKGVKLWSPAGNLDDKSTHIALTNGHTFIIPHDKEGVVVPKKFRREAIARGCIPVGMEEDPDDESIHFDREGTIRKAINRMMDSDDKTYFTTDGFPNLAKVSELCQFQVSRIEVNRVFNEMNSGAESDDADTETAVTS